MLNAPIHLMPMLADAAELLNHVLPHRVHRIGTFVVSNHMIMISISALLCLIIFTYVGSKAKKNQVPTGAHNFFEAMLSLLRTEIFRPALGENCDRFLPFLWTMFFFILFCNLLGLIPVGEIIALANGRHESHLWGTATANFSVTGGLAIISFVTVHMSGIIQQVRIKMDPSLAPHHSSDDHAPPHGHGEMHGMEGIEDERDVVYDHHVGDGHDHAHGMHHSKEFHGKPFPVAVITGIGSYIWNFAPHPETGNKAGDLLLFVLLLLLESIGSLVKPFSLCVRLFANMVAGHLVIAALVALIPFALGLLWAGPVSIIVVIGCTCLSLLELFVAFLQTYIFTFLTTLYIASAVAPEH